MTRTEIAGFRPKLYKTLQENATQKTLFQHEISGLGVVQRELHHEGGHDPIGDIRLAEAEANSYAALETQVMAA
jgi:hypothetical protein